MNFSKLAVLIFVLLPISVQAQGLTETAKALNGPAETQSADEVKIDKFHRSLRKAIKSAVRNGSLSPAKALQLRVRLMAPAVRAAAEDLAVAQMAFSEDAEILPYDVNGKVERASIDWDNFLAFLEGLIPLILKMIDLFGV